MRQALNFTDFEAVIVDLDGTMVDTLGDFVVVLSRTLHDLGLSAVPRSHIARTVGKGSEHLIREILRQAGGDPEAQYEAAWARYQRHYEAINGDYASVFDGVPQALSRWRDQGLKLACLTNKPTGLAQQLLARKGLASFFSGVFGGDAFARKKPDPLPVWLTCEALHVPPARALMVGDSSNDAQAARAAGCPVALVTYGYNHGVSVHTVEADAWVDRLDAL